MTTETKRVSIVRLAGGTRNLALLTLLIAAALGVNLVNPNFLTLDNIAVIGLQMSFIGIAAIGTSFLMIGGQIDLSIGSTFALSSVVAAIVAKLVGPELGLAVGLVTGAAIGLLNGAIVWFVRISPLIVTLGSLTFVRGLVLIVTGNRSIGNLPQDFSLLGQFRLFGLPSPLIFLLILGAIAAFVLSKTVLGLRLRAYGDSNEAAELAGLSPRRLVLGLFAFNGLMAGAAGVLAASRLDGASPNFGVGFELDVITAVLLGGVSIFGGEGRVLGVMLAVAVLGVVQAGIVAIGLDPNIGKLVTGAALILAVCVDQFSHKRHEYLQRKMALEEFSAEGGAAERMGLRAKQSQELSGK